MHSAEAHYNILTQAGMAPQLLSSQQHALSPERPTSQGAITRSVASSRQSRPSGSATRVPPPSAASVDTPEAGSSSGAHAGGADRVVCSENGTSTVTSMPAVAVSVSAAACRCQCQCNSV